MRYVTLATIYSRLDIKEEVDLYIRIIGAKERQDLQCGVDWNDDYVLCPLTNMKELVHPLFKVKLFSIKIERARDRAKFIGEKMDRYIFPLDI